jgi:hypothetical protein
LHIEKTKIKNYLSLSVTIGFTAGFVN